MNLSASLQFRRPAQMKRHGGIALVNYFLRYLQTRKETEGFFSETPAGVISLTDIQKLDLYKRKNPFESPYASPLSSSPSSSDEELYSHALTLHAPMAPVQTSTRRPAPAPPPRNLKSADTQETHGS